VKRGGKTAPGARPGRRGGKHPPPLQSIVWGLVVLSSLASAFAAAYFTTFFLYKILGLHPVAWVTQVGNSFLGLIFTALLGTLFSKVFRPRIESEQMGVFGPIIRAMEQIARGDFSVRLDNELGEHENQLLGSLVKSVNHMAVELDQMEQMRQEFISNVSHEIQSPLTSIRGFAQALRSEDLSPEDRRHYLSIIENESTRLSRITENLLRLAALEAEHVKFEPLPYRLDKQVRSLILACEPQWTDKNIEMDAALEEVTFTGDEDLLSQVWINLIHNSIKFTPAGGKIWVSLCPQEAWIEFKISDTGIGIAAEDQERIFERFYKADASRTSAGGGSGLGLSIARKIVEMHKGTIGVESQPGAGAAFTVHLPSGG
jgi:two-component system, OmpR family, phosphate regulon sensor histidine kinase PhoR